WLEVKTQSNKDYYEMLYGNGGVMSYDISDYFQVECGVHKVDPLDFWRNEGIYDFLYPIKGAVKNLKALYKEGYEIRFVSHCKGNHHKSKYNFYDGFLYNEIQT